MYKGETETAQESSDRKGVKSKTVMPSKNSVALPISASRQDKKSDKQIYSISLRPLARKDTPIRVHNRDRQKPLDKGKESIFVNVVLV